ncbi:type II secretion system protein [Enterococcus sp. DIV1314a]|uniref:type II secretion system protein n=1 Tax=Enterococcus sp. DIV1314a TaxID=2774660 RepID=UPI003F26B35E
MRNKLKKIWNKEDGFTLVELLGVIVILGIILAIAIPAIGNIVDNATTNTEKNQAELVVDAAKMYVLDNGNTIPTSGEITSTELVTAGYLEKAPKKVYTVKITKDGKNIKYDAGAGAEVEVE